MVEPRASEFTGHIHKYNLRKTNNQGKLMAQFYQLGAEQD